jgi:hypothetical protein
VRHHGILLHRHGNFRLGKWQRMPLPVGATVDRVPLWLATQRVFRSLAAVLITELWQVLQLDGGAGGVLLAAVEADGNGVVSLMQ